MERILERYPRHLHLRDDQAVTLRPLEAGDADGLIALFRNVSEDELRGMRDNVTDPSVIRRWTADLDYERVLPILAERDGEIIGEVSLHRRPTAAHAHIAEMRIYVREEDRGKGLGSHLIDDMIELARDLGLEQLVVELSLEDASMISAFERRGFEREAILSVYQLVIMRYDLVRRPGQEALSISHADRLPPRRLWPDLLFDKSVLQVPAMLNLSSLLDEAVERGWGERAAIRYRDEVVTYDLLLGEVMRLASSLARLGVRAGDAVILHLPNTPQAIAANFAVQRLGALSVPTPPQLSLREMAHIAAESDAVAAITTADLLDVVLQVRQSGAGRLGPVIVQGIDGASPAEQIYSYAALVARGEASFSPTPRRHTEIGLLLYTSADSGRPRGTAHRLDGLYSVLESFGKHVWRINEEDVIGSLSPLGFAQGFVTFGLLPFGFGASVALPDDPMAHTGPDLVQTIRRHRVTLLLASPITYREILADPRLDEFDLASLRLCASGGEPLTRETYEAWERRFGQPIFEGFGTTEMLYAFLSNAVGMKPRPGSLGRVVPGYEVKVIGDMGNTLNEGEIGFLMVRGPTGTLYWNDPDSQRRAVRNGWNRLSDYGYEDSDGYFWYVARSDDMIKTRSYRIDPNEVERVIAEHPHVAEVAVIGLPDEMRGQRPVAYVVPGAREEPGEQLRRSILGSLRSRLADYKIPDTVVFVEELPRNAHGQLMRRVLRDQLRRQQGD